MNSTFGQSFHCKKYPRLLVRLSAAGGPTLVMQRHDPVSSPRLVRILQASEDVHAFTRRVIEVSGNKDGPLQWTK